jgi:alpha-glucosidase
VPGSTLELYREALRLRRSFEGGSDNDSDRDNDSDSDSDSDSDLVWHDSPAGTLVFSRGDLLCTVNLTGTPVGFGVEGELLLASDVPGAADSAAWWKVKCVP